MSKEDLKQLRKQHIKKMELNEKIDAEMRKERKRSNKTQPSGPSLSLARFGVFGIFGAIAATVFAFSLPLTYASAKPEIGLQTFAPNLHVLTYPTMRDSMMEDHGLAFDRILTDAADETSASMRRIARACRRGGKETHAFAGSGLEQRLFERSTSYLTCAMSRDQARFCDPAERARLVEQLIQYRDRQMGLVAIRGFWDEFKKSGESFADSELSTYVAFGKNGPARISEQLDHKVGMALHTLVAGGYISASDFGWSGFYLPEAYAPYLETQNTPPTVCG